MVVMLFRVMNTVSRSNTLLWCAFRGGSVLNQTCFIRAVHRLNPLSAAPVNFTQFDHRRSLCESSHGSAHLLSTGHSHKPAETFNIDVLVSLLRQENAVDLCVIKVPEHIKYAQYFIVASGVSPRHLRAMALYAIKVYKFLKTKADPNATIEGKDAEDWLCIDFGTMVMHLMLPQTRETYELDKLWTLSIYDEQLKKIPAETIPEDFVLDLEFTK
ncbi:mitochondrial assembly of ribosomal large subunit protein 1 [Gouania willdenowi]|uniref:Mitochondrial assembly of ribosomal large subunit protein 1 n=1 Tax=Gouania willdenowi TaxID=441366 RepID=A0A8C5EMX3_GOUWI|nr:mitochondrial assembly of ribosomal large subunit protein 1 [Gouania willdenowi]